jgi:Superinfection immunity protein
MSTQFRLFVGAGLAALAILLVAIGLARNTSALAAPAHLLLFLMVVALYLVPSGLAVHRNCVATGWIIALNVLLGWTLFGWVAALGWAAAGKTAALPPAPPVRPLAGH